jgi:hypothetical protein
MTAERGLTIYHAVKVTATFSILVAGHRNLSYSEYLMSWLISAPQFCCDLGKFAVATLAVKDLSYSP